MSEALTQRWSRQHLKINKYLQTSVEFLGSRQEETKNREGKIQQNRRENYTTETTK
jgi:hypothetical protein